MCVVGWARLWFDELIGIWEVCDINPGWETVRLTTTTDTTTTVRITQGSCASLEFRDSLEKSLNFRKLNCFGERVEGVVKSVVNVRPVDCANFLP